MKTWPEFRVKYWPLAGLITGMMPWTVVYKQTPQRGMFPIMARCYTKHRAMRICRALNAQSMRQE